MRGDLEEVQKAARSLQDLLLTDAGMNAALELMENKGTTPEKAFANYSEIKAFMNRVLDDLATKKVEEPAEVGLWGGWDEGSWGSYDG